MGRWLSNDSSNKSFLKITGVLAAISILLLVILLPVYFEVIEPNAMSTTEPMTATPSISTNAPLTSPLTPETNAPTLSTSPLPTTSIPPATQETVPSSGRVDCFPEGNATRVKCNERGCTWSESEDGLAPPCHFTGPRLYTASGGVVNEPDGLSSTLLSRPGDLNHYGQNFPKLSVRTTYISAATVRIKIYPEENRYEVPMSHPDGVRKPLRSRFSVEHSAGNGEFGVKVTRRSTSTTLFDTSFGELMFSDQFLQISTRVASEYIYGFGEQMHERFKHDMNWKTYGMFSRDKSVEPGFNLYGVHPYFICMEGDGNSYGVFFVNSNAMDVTMQPTPAVTYRTTGGLLDFYIFLGPSVEEVTEQYTSIIGRPFIPPYWSLGFQLSRWGYNSLQNLTKVVERNINADIPYDVQYSDIDYMERRLGFTIDESYSGLGDFLRELKNVHNMRYVIILAPATSGNETEHYAPFDNGIRDDIFIKNTDRDVLWGKVWPILPGVSADSLLGMDWAEQLEYRSFTAFPDFYHPNSTKWWSELINDFHKTIEFDGLWIDMNEPASFVDGSLNGCPFGNKFENPPYVPKLASGHLYDKTICMSSIRYHPRTQLPTEHYNVHSLYGYSESLPTLEACRTATGKRCIVISRSTYPGSGKYAGHWLGDNTSTWSHLAASIIGMLEFNLFGIPYVGADVCGFFGDTNYELCLRWMQLGAFYPFYRNHNVQGTMDQDPAFFGDEFISKIKSAMETRYTLMPYLYTLFYESHKTGATVIKSLMSQFPNDNSTYEIDRQLMWGSGLLITPVLEPGEDSVTGYFPSARWFDYYNGVELQNVGTHLTLNAPIDYINVHICGGNIIPTQQSAKTTYQSRMNDFGLIVALDEDRKAEGGLFWDDGNSIDTISKMEYTEVEFSCEKHLLRSKVLHSHDTDNLTLSHIRILGVRDTVTRVKTDGKDILFTFHKDRNEIMITDITLDFKVQFEVRWEINDEWRRIDCTASRSERTNRITCLQRGCVWNPSPDASDGVPSCYFAYDGLGVLSVPSYSGSLSEQNDGSSSYELSYDDGSTSIYGSPAQSLRFDMEYQTNNRFHFKIRDADGYSFEIPQEIINLPSHISSDEESALYGVEVTQTPFSLRIFRKETEKTIFDTSVGPVIFEEKFLQLSTSLPSESVFGFGEHNHRRYRHDLHWKRWGMFSRDIIPVADTNSYGHQTFFMAMDDEDLGSAVGVYFHNANAMDVIFQPTPLLTYRTNGGVLDFYILLADSQEALVQEYHNLVGLPMMPPYWGLGFQLSRWGYWSLDRVKEVVNEMREAEIPFDVQYGDIDYMEEFKDFTYDKVNFAGLPEFVDQLHSWGMKYVIILDPAIKIEEKYEAYEKGLQSNVFVMADDGIDPVISRVWPGPTHHTDYTHPNASAWWHEQCDKFFHEDGIQYDALWVDMNEPSNFQSFSPLDVFQTNCSSEFNKPPYMPKILWFRTGLNSRTLCMESRQFLGQHYNLHSLYGHTMSTVTHNALEQIMPDKRSFVITRSTFGGTGKYAGHWLGDNQSLWPPMAWAITGMIEFNLFGIPYVGADICGFMFDATAELCQRWMQVGAFYPFARNHNANGRKPQHPTVFGSEVTESSKKVLKIRYSILPYMYTLHHLAHWDGGTVIRALVHEFPSDKNTWTADGQFLVGGSFLVTPVLEEGSTRVIGYFPSAVRWYDFHTGKELSRRGQFVSLDAPLDHINLHVRGGGILPMQDPAVTTVLSRSNPMSLLVALDDFENAFGELYWDDGEARIVGDKYVTVHFSCSKTSLNFTIHHPPFDFDVSNLFLERVTILGLRSDSIGSVMAYNNTGDATGGSGNPADYIYESGILKISGLSFRLDQPHVITWS